MVMVAGTKVDPFLLLMLPLLLLRPFGAFLTLISKGVRTPCSKFIG